jgi:hypothetical protein
MIGPNRKILYLNPAAETLHGKLDEELIGKACPMISLLRVLGVKE